MTSDDSANLFLVEIDVTSNSSEDVVDDENALGQEKSTCLSDERWRPIKRNWDSSVDEFIRKRLSQSDGSDFTKSLVDDYTRGVDDFNCSPE